MTFLDILKESKCCSQLFIYLVIASQALYIKKLYFVHSPNVVDTYKYSMFYIGVLDCAHKIVSDTTVKQRNNHAVPFHLVGMMYYLLLLPILLPLLIQLVIFALVSWVKI